MLFDGTCVMCSRSVRRLIAMDKRGVLQFASLDSPAANRLLGEVGVKRADLPDSMILIEPEQGVRAGRASSRSEALLGIARLLGGPYAMAGVLRIVPRVIRDGVYRFIATNRHRLGSFFGRADQCPVMTDATTKRFLHQ